MGTREPLRIRRTDSGVTHALALCAECPWSCEDYRAAHREATQHAKEYGHRVKVERASSYLLEPKR